MSNYFRKFVTLRKNTKSLWKICFFFVLHFVCEFSVFFFFKQKTAYEITV